MAKIYTPITFRMMVDASSTWVCVLSTRFSLPVDVPSVAYGIIFLETVQSGLVLADLFHLIGSMEDVYQNRFTSSYISSWSEPILVGSVAAALVQSFFAYRIWVLSDKKLWWSCLTILFVSLLDFKYPSITGSQRKWFTLDSSPLSVEYQRLSGVSM